MKPEFSDNMRSFQDQFETRRLADRILEKAFHDTLTNDDRAFVEDVMFFFMATTNAEGQPQCSYKGGPRGFVKVTTESEIAFPLYEGNGLYISAGNLDETGKIGLLFIDFEKQKRMRINGVARIDRNDPLLSKLSAAQQIVRFSITDIHPNCPRNVHKMTLVEQSKYTPQLETDDVGKAAWSESFDDVLSDHMKPDEYSN